MYVPEVEEVKAANRNNNDKLTLSAPPHTHSGHSHGLVKLQTNNFSFTRDFVVTANAVADLTFYTTPDVIMYFIVLL